MTALEINSEISEGLYNFYKEFQQYVGQPAIAAKMLAGTSELQGFSSYVDVLGRVAVSKFPSALDTLSSLEEQADRDTIHAAEAESIAPYVLRALHKRICSNPAVSEPLKKAIEAAAAQGAKLTTPTSEQLAVGAATLVGVTIATTFTGPIAVALAPLIGGVTLLIVQCGLDAFCEWAQKGPSNGG